MTDLEKQKQFIEMRAKGMSYQKIATEISVSYSTLINWGKEFSMEIANAHTLELEVLQDEFVFIEGKKDKTIWRKIEDY